MDSTKPDTILMAEGSQSSDDSQDSQTEWYDTRESSMDSSLASSSSSNSPLDYSTGDNSKVGFASTSLFNQKQMEDNLRYFNMQNIGSTWSDLMQDEIKKNQNHSNSDGNKAVYVRWTEESDQMTHKIDQEVGKATFRFDKPINVPGLHEAKSFFHVKNATVRTDSVRAVNCLGLHIDANLDRAHLFEEYPDKIFFLPGAISFPLVPGLCYEFVASKNITKGGAKANADEPIPFQANIGKYETWYILKKSLRWDSLEFTGMNENGSDWMGKSTSLSTKLCLDLFSYLRDFCTRKFILKAMTEAKLGGPASLTLDNYDTHLDQAIAKTPQTQGFLIFQVDAAIRLLKENLDGYDEIVDETGVKETISDESESDMSTSSIKGFWTLTEIVRSIKSLDTDSETYKNQRYSMKNRNKYENRGKRDDPSDHTNRKTSNVSMFRPLARVNPFGELFDHTTGVGIGLRKVFYHHVLSPLYPYYSKSQLLHLTLPGLMRLRETFQVSPASLCMFPAFSDLMYDSHGVQTATLRELNMKAFREIEISHPEINVTPVMKKAVGIYKHVVNHCIQFKNKYVKMSALTCSFGSPDIDLFKQAISFLLDKSAIVKFSEPKRIDLDKLSECVQKLNLEEDTSEPPSSKTPHPLTNIDEFIIDPKDEKKPSLLIDEDESESDEDLIALAHIRFTEKSIVESITKMFDNFRTSPPELWDQEKSLPCLRSTKWDLSLEPKPQKNPLCSEQLRARQALIDGCKGYGSPIISIVGTGGSGKTKCLIELKSHMRPNSYIVVAGYGANAAGCKIVDHNARTIHSILRTHSLVCPKSPMFDRHAYDACSKIDVSHKDELDKEGRRIYDTLSDQEKLEMDNQMEAKGLRFPFTHPDSKKGSGRRSLCCMLHYVDTIIIDEISLVGDELMGSLLSCVSQCGNLKRLIVCGDFRQNPSLTLADFMKDIQLGFPWSTIPFTHCHRFSSNALLSTNAKAIYERRFEDIEFDPDCYKLIQVNESDCSNRRNRTATELDEFKEMYRCIFREHNIRALSDNIVITRSNEKRWMLSEIIQEITFGTKNHFNVGQKIFLMINDDDCHYVHNQLLVVHRIEDIELGKLKGKKGKSDRTAFVNARGTIMNSVTTTSEPPTDPHDTFRRIIAIPLPLYCESYGEREKKDNQIIIPFFGHHKSIVRDGSVVTPQFMQGSEIAKMTLDQLTYWDESDDHRVFFTNVTRCTEQAIFISTPETLAKCITNPHKDRASVLWTEFTWISVEHAVWLYEKHAKRRRVLEETKTRICSNRLTPEENYLLRHFPTPQSLYVPISNAVERLMEEEDGKFDAEKLVEIEKTRKMNAVLVEKAKMKAARKAEKKAARKAARLLEKKKDKSRKRSRSKESEVYNENTTKRRKTRK